MPWIGRLRAVSMQSWFRSAGLPREGVVQKRMYSVASRVPHMQTKVNHF